ncbi:hypothetical protein HBI56_070670 [Parastagonospora nodorum]|uniref:Uncharacterized protein n=1 Tax=Phaeosphaeria nodorum (strain SN15 / ATCC MYA-4574 / FGSC 10173) TaxID=321614 RepID=A0A7U2EP48_PHANO|nr:hypothetical protein HBH56_005100 [Parastagonospora nodorum]QRC90392.1 hypothetical protein JI435_400390 [Parastagonospora nodorum SN15]KAH3937772.1 hypothetical protein HBH54_005090 [Parastagonospora nodorum]KAH3946661.1 hypothetical protein HBH53_126870 [Parastagonospora nodorum]KAH3975135.1 hypothetical protein HBH51_087850 [Parastagonospora nodorum]
MLWRADGTRDVIHCGLCRLPNLEKTDALFLPAACHVTFAVSARTLWSCGWSLFPGSPNTVKPLASSSLRHVPFSDAPSFETGSLAPKTAAKLMQPALEPQALRRSDRIQTNVPSSSGLTCLASGFF